METDSVECVPLPDNALATATAEERRIVGTMLERLEAQRPRAWTEAERRREEGRVLAELRNFREAKSAAKKEAAQRELTRAQRRAERRAPASKLIARLPFLAARHGQVTTAVLAGLFFSAMLLLSLRHDLLPMHGNGFTWSADAPLEDPIVAAAAAEKLAAWKDSLLKARREQLLADEELPIENFSAEQVKVEL